MIHSGAVRNLLLAALLAPAQALLPGPAAAAPKAMIVLSSAAYGVGPLTQEMAGGVATDAAENVYVTGGSDLDRHTVTYSNVLTQSLVPPLVFPNSQGKGITTDSLGNIIVAGVTNPIQHYLTLKYNSSFTTLISSALYNGGNSDSAAAVRVDSQNNIFVTGASNIGGNNDYYTIKYGPNLNILSTAAYAGPNNSRDDAAALAVDHADNVIVAGFSGTGAAANFYIIKYDNNLKVLNQVAFDSGGIDQATGVAVDLENNIIVTGNQLIGATNNYCTLKYDAFLTLLSSAVYDSGAANTDIPTGVAVDSNDNIIVTGFSGPGIAFDYFTIKYDKNFAVLSSSTYNGGSIDMASGIAVDASDNVLVTGTSNNGAKTEYVTIKYNASPKIKAVSPLFIGETYDVTLDGNGFLASSSVTFTDPGISTGTISFIAGQPGQLRVSATLGASVMLGITTVTVTNLNGETVSSYALAATRLRKTVNAGSAGALAAQARAGQVLVTIPAGTFPFQELVTIYAVPAVAGNPSPVGEALRVEVSPPEAPQQDLEVTLHYSQADLGDYPEGNLSLAYFSTSSVWVPLPGSVLDAVGNSITVRTRFVNTAYAIVKAAQGAGGGGGAGGSGIPAKVYPNPYRPGSGGSFDQSPMGKGIVFAEIGANKSFTLTIVDVAGQLVYQKSAVADSLGRFLWDAKTASGGDAASGVYLYVVTGAAQPRKGKFSIIR